MKAIDRARWILFFLALIASSGLLAATAFLKPVGNDVGTYLTIADGINRGALPYRDFFDHKTPGIYYLFALLLKMSGHSLAALRVVHLIAIVVVALLTALLAGRLQDRTVGLLAGMGVLYGGSAFVATDMTAEVWVALLVVSAMGWLLRRWPKLELSWYDWLIAGLLLGVATLFKQTALLSVLAVTIWMWFLPSGQAALARSLLWLALGVAAPIILVIGYFVAQGVLGDLWSNVVVANVCCYSAEELKPRLRNTLVVARAFPVLWLGLGAALFAAPPSRASTLNAGSPATTLLWLVLATSLLPLAHRAYLHYLFHAIPAAAILSATGLIFMGRRLVAKSSLAAGVAACALLMLALIDAPRWPHYLAWTNSVQQQQAEVARFVQLHTAPDEPILSISGEPQFYFLSERPPATRWLYLYDVNYTPEREQEWAQIISDSDVRTVVTFDGGNLPWHGRLFRLLEQTCPDIRAFNAYWHVFRCNRSNDT